MLGPSEQKRVLALLETVKAPRSGGGKVQVTFVLNFAPGGTLSRLQYDITESGDVPK